MPTPRWLKQPACWLKEASQADGDKPGRKWKAANGRPQIGPASKEPESTTVVMSLLARQQGAQALEAGLVAGRKGASR